MIKITFILITFSIFIISPSLSDEKNCKNIKTVKKYLECKNDPNKSLKNITIGSTSLKDIKKKLNESKLKKTFDSFKNKKSLSDLAK